MTRRQRLNDEAVHELSPKAKRYEVIEPELLNPINVHHLSPQVIPRDDHLNAARG
jgi:hypothetical protein